MTAGPQFVRGKAMLPSALVGVLGEARRGGARPPGVRET